MNRPFFFSIFGVAVLSSLACAGLSDYLPVSDGEGTDADPPEDPEELAEAMAVEALVATSGAGVEATIDGDDTTSWSPAGDPDLEGVLIRLADPTEVSRVELVGCSKGTAELYLDGTSVQAGQFEEGEDWAVDLEDGGGPLGVRPAGGGPMPASTRSGWSDRTGPWPWPPPRRVPGEVRTSSTLDPEAAYRTAYLFDGRSHFAWVEGVKGNGEGETITVNFDDPVALTGLEVWNGYQRSLDHYNKNVRLAKIAVKMDGGEAQILEVADVSSSQVLDLDPALEGQELQIEVVEVHKGSRYSDLVVSELRFLDAEGPFTLGTDAMADAERELVERLGDEHLGGVLGKAYSSRCGDLGRLKLRADSSFVWYESGDGVEEVFEGAWADKSVGVWSEVESVRSSPSGRRDLAAPTERPRWWSPPGSAAAPSGSPGCRISERRA